MEIPSWAKWYGEYKNGCKLYLSDDQYYMFMPDGASDSGLNESSVKAWEGCGWELSEINITLENK